MSIDLFEHNAKAYDAAVSMLFETGKAAIVHPTGTGKSFIGFKLAEDNSDSIICWLSPSEYIFKTQIENLKATGADEPENIKFYTYAKLMNMSEDELAEIQPDWLVIDEFHRCGAQMWGGGVQNLLGMYPDAPVLGLSATNIRYLDNQRDMADELFDGNVASEMTLGEAIVRGILAPPKYVISVYSYQKDLERYQRQVQRAKSKAVRDAAQKYLDALKHALDKADGLEDIFDKHLTERHGKYILFCSNITHMRAMAALATEWFKKVDPSPRVYKVYSEDPEASASFRAFKADNNNDSLRLLYCIDALNEGVHVDDISGVILLRPTVSPIIFKQQIGRALTAGKQKKPAVIIDVINNISGIYSIDAIKDEMQTAISYYRDLGDGEPIVNERFRIIDELRDCRELFDELQKTLTASWSMMFKAASEYRTEYGNLEIPRRYRTADNLALGSWLVTQKRVKAGKIPGILTQEQVKQLESIGIRWEDKTELAWNKNFAACQEYFNLHGNLDVKVNYFTPDGLALGRWISNIRQQRAGNTGGTVLTDEHIAALDSLSMIWDKISFQWEQNYTACADYYVKNGSLNMPTGYVSPDGLRIGMWLLRMRQIRSGRLKKAAPLTESQIERLNALGFDWTDKFTSQWNYGYEQAELYYRQHGNLDVPVAFINENNFALGKWLRRHIDDDEKTGRTSIKVTPERRKKLEALGFSFETEDGWNKRIALCREYYETNGNLNVSQRYVVDDIWLGKWLYLCRRTYRGEIKGEALTQEQTSDLEAVGIDWLTPNERKWENNYLVAQKLYLDTGNINVEHKLTTEDNVCIGRWLALQKRYFADGKLTQEQIDKLNTLEIKWVSEDTWEQTFSRLKEYADKHGSLTIPRDYTTPEGIKLSAWLRNQISAYNGKNKYRSLTDEQVEKLEAVGVVWRKVKTWDEAYELARSYYTDNHSLKMPVGYTVDGYSLYEWLRKQKKAYLGQVKPELTDEQIVKLKAIGMVFKEPKNKRDNTQINLQNEA